MKIHFPSVNVQLFTSLRNFLRLAAGKRLVSVSDRQKSSVVRGVHIEHAALTQKPYSEASVIHRIRLPLAFFLVWLIQTPIQAAPITLSFDDLVDGESLSTQIPGVSFSNATVLTSGISLNEFEFPPRSEFNVISDSDGPIGIAFDVPILSFYGYFTYLSPLTLLAFDAGNNQVGVAASLFGSNLALSGDPGSSPNELLTVNFAGGITRVSITADPLGGSFVLDDATLGLMSSDVPEPRTAPLILTVGTVAFVWFRLLLRSNMKKTTRIFSLIVFLAVGALWLNATPPMALDRQIQEVSLTPTILTQGSSQPFVVSARIDDPNIVTSSVFLLRILPSGQSQSIGVLNDDGSNGDLVSKDHIFTATLSLANEMAGQIRLRISAAFRGTLLRTQTPELIVTIAPPMSKTGWVTLTDTQRMFSIQAPAIWDLRLAETLSPNSGAVKEVHVQFSNGTTLMVITVHTKSEWLQLQTSDFTVPSLLGATPLYVFGISTSQDEYVVPGHSDSSIRNQLHQVIATFTTK